MAEHPIQGLMQTAMENIKEMVDVNTIVGDPVQTPDGRSVIMPISRVGFGFVAGGSDIRLGNTADTGSAAEQQTAVVSLPFGGGSGGGVSITPIAFLVVNEQGVNIVSLDNSTHLWEKMMESAPKVFEKIQTMVGGGSQTMMSGMQNIMPGSMGTGTMGTGGTGTGGMGSTGGTGSGFGMSGSTGGTGGVTGFSGSSGTGGLTNTAGLGTLMNAAGTGTAAGSGLTSAAVTGGAAASGTTAGTTSGTTSGNTSGTSAGAATGASSGQSDADSSLSELANAITSVSSSDDESEKSSYS